jgi:hypothetical protein
LVLTKVLVRISASIFNFGPLFCHPSTIKCMIESFHRFPRVFGNLALRPFQNVWYHDVVGNSAMLRMLLKFIA